MTERVDKAGSADFQYALNDTKNNYAEMLKKGIIS